jgi:hypothetical protein
MAMIAAAVFILMPLVLTAVGLLARTLWNHLMPQIFGLPQISFWQTLGLLVLSWLFFGGLRGSGGMRWRGGMRERMRERWERMTPEERAAFRQRMGERWCGVYLDEREGAAASSEPAG